MNRRTFLTATAAALAGPAAAAPPTNVLFVLSDQWRSTAFDHSTDPVVQTPHLTQFAGESASFTRTYAANPVCTPNRSCILTGRYSHQHSMIHNNIMLPPKTRTLAHVFQEAGYATHYIGKWHMDGREKPGFVPPGWRRRGFQTFEGFNIGHYYPTGAQYFTNEGKLLRPDVYEPTYQTDLAIDFMRRNRARPFYCYLSWGPPHAPYKPPQNWDIYDPAKLEFRPNVPAKLHGDARYGKMVAGYYGSCSALDHEFGRLMGFLGETGLAANTLVVFTSDHGDMLGSHGCYSKSKPEDESLHVPLYMRQPGRTRPRQKVTVLTSSIDLAPTILATCGLRLKTAIGRDLSATLLGGPEPKVDFVYAEGMMRRRTKDGAVEAPTDGDDDGGKGAKGASRLGGVAGGSEWRSYVTPAHKLVVRADGKPGALFHLEKDPYEFKNLVGERSSAALEKDLLEKMRGWAREVGDPFPEPSAAAETMYTAE